ncbi:hypothetical protein GCM10020358_24220 [Amorphoplanes nipponensis]|uniref:hypothetical protein n=1 Tax=Actinoplanes nipponensis TaxID=135950 RepID=UPI0031E5764A
MDIAAASSANGTAVQLYDCNAEAAQKLEVATDGTAAQGWASAMDVAAARTANGSLVLQLSDCNGTGDSSGRRRATARCATGEQQVPDASDNSSPTAPARRSGVLRGTTSADAARCDGRPRAAPRQGPRDPYHHDRAQQGDHRGQRVEGGE